MDFYGNILRSFSYYSFVKFSLYSTICLQHQCSPMAVEPSDKSGNDLCGPVNSYPAADGMFDENFGANPVFLGRNLSLGPEKNDHVHPLGLAIICEEVKKEYVVTF